MTSSTGIPLLDVSAIPRLSNEDAAHLLGLIDGLSRRGAPVFLALGGHATREEIQGVGLGEFLRIFPDRATFDRAFEAGRLCPHAARWLGEVKGIAAYGPSSPRSWRPFYNLACVAARSGTADEALSLLREAVARGLRRPEFIRHQADFAAVVATESYARWEREVFEHPPEPSPQPISEEEGPSTCSTVLRE